MRLLSLIALLCTLSTTVAFVPQQGARKAAVSLFAKKQAKPAFNKKTEKWEKASDDDGKYPYGAIGSLLRHGPSPFISRVTNPGDYEQDVLMYMAQAGVTRSEATGNMDAKSNNAMDWVFQKTEEKNGAAKVDYTELSTKDAILVAVWAFGITPLVVNVLIQTVSQFSIPERYQ